MLTKTVSIHEAETNLMELIKLVLQGDEIIIIEADKPLVRLPPVSEPVPPRVAGLNKGEIWASDDFDEPLSCLHGSKHFQLPRATGLVFESF